jgi:hypothetical protein
MDSLPRTIHPKLPPSLALSSLYASATYNVDQYPNQCLRLVHAHLYFNPPIVHMSFPKLK